MTWNILTTDPRREFAVTAGLVGYGVTVYLPTCQCRVRAAPNTGKEWRTVDRPLFPSYLFARMAGGAAWKAAHALAGYSGYLRAGDEPATLSEAAIAMVRVVEEDLAKKAMVKREAPFQPGDTVRIEEDGNPWTGLMGTVERLDKSDRTILLLIVAGNSWRVSVPTMCLRDAAHRATSTA